MAYTQYWTERDSFFRRSEHIVRNELLHEVFHNSEFSVFRMKDGNYAVTDWKPDPGSEVDRIYQADRDTVLKLIGDPALWSLFRLQCLSAGMSVLLDADGCANLRKRHTDGSEPDSEELSFRAALKSAEERQKEIEEQEKIIGTPEWRKSVEREVHVMAQQDRERMKGKPAFFRVFLEPSVRRRLKNEQDYIYEEQNRRIYEAMEEQRIREDGTVSKNTLIAGAIALAGILLFYLLVSLRRFSLQFIPATVCGLISVLILVRDQNCDRKNMNARLIAWIVTIVCVILALTAIVSMLS